MPKDVKVDKNKLWYQYNTNPNAHLPSISHKAQLTDLGCLKAKILPFFQYYQVTPVYLYEPVKQSGLSDQFSQVN